jgi:serine/threonine protein kinase
VDNQLDIDVIYAAALALQGTAERSAYLDRVCTESPELRERVDRLLAAEPGIGSFLETPAAEICATDVQRTAEKPGMSIGPYKLLQQIGEGGMGVVYMAEQTSPVRRKVALKVIKPGMDSHQVIARFEAERQALALMDHANIARVIDAGTTETGRPYFVMDLVHGVPITRYCDDCHLTPRQRLELFMPVCQAIQHAHQKGIIHRDIKPSNVMVTLYDGKPVPKVIDFGVAKATQQKLTDDTLFTQYGTMVGTLEYMSPEQAEMSALGIDTRSDIYSLGVLLYELLTGSTPLGPKRIKETAFAEILRLIKEEEPSKPSTRLSESGATLASISAQRDMEPARLTRLLRGELDWIVMKTLEKDRNRRYETASELMADVHRHLHDQPVEAGPPSTMYRFRKFSRRNKAALMASSLVIGALILGLCGTTWQAVRATNAERSIQVERDSALKAERIAQLESERATQEAARANREAAVSQAVNKFIHHDLLGQASPYISYERYSEPQSELKLVAVLDRASTQLAGRFEGQPAVEAELQHTIGFAYYSIQKRHRSQPHLQRAFDLRRQILGGDHPATLDSMHYLAAVKGDLALSAQVVDARRRVLGTDHVDTLRSMNSYALLVSTRGDREQAIGLFRDTLDAQQRGLGRENSQTAWTMHLLANVLLSNTEQRQGAETENREIESLFRQAIIAMRKAHRNSWYTFDIILRFAQFLRSRSRFEEAEALLVDARTRVEKLPAVPIGLKTSLFDELDGLYGDWGDSARIDAWRQTRTSEAEARLAEIVGQMQLGASNANLMLCRSVFLARLDRLDEAEASCLSAMEMDAQNEDATSQLQRLAEVQFSRRDWERAERLQSRVYASRRDQFGVDSMQAASALHALSRMRRERGDLPAAEVALTEAVSLHRKHFGDDHPATATVIHDLAFLLIRIPGREPESEGLYREALAVRKRALGGGDAATADTAFRLAEALGKQTKLDEAEKILRESYAAMSANRVSKAVREFEPILLQWNVEMCRGWNRPALAAAWESKLRAIQSTTIRD